MSFTVNDIYRPVCTALLETAGLSLGITTEATFLDYLRTTLETFLSRTRLMQDVFVQPLFAGISEYDKPAWVADLEQVWLKDRTIERSNEAAIEVLRRDSRKELGAPDQWRNDRLPTDKYAVYPIPNTNSALVEGPIGGGFGVLSSLTTGELDIAAGENAYGVPSDEYGAVALLVHKPAYGVISNISYSGTGLMGIGAAAPSDGDLAITTAIFSVPKAFWPYLKYGVLALIFSESSEHKDPVRAQICNEIFEEGIRLGAAIMENLEAA